MTSRARRPSTPPVASEVRRPLAAGPLPAGPLPAAILAAAVLAAAVLTAALALVASPPAARAQITLGASPPTPVSAAASGPAALEAAVANFPPLILFANVRATTPQDPVPRACPAPGGRIEQKGGPTMEFLGSVPGRPELCRMRVGGEEVEAWYGIWVTGWPGADPARRGLERIMHARTGDVVGFDTVAGPGLQWHDLIRQDGIEDITLLGKTYRALKIAHYREGYGGNNYRSVSTLWKDVDSGLPLYGTYQHISGQPVVDDPLIPTAIVPAG